MRLLVSWLSEFVDLDIPLKQLCEMLTLAGLEEEGVEGATFSFKDVIVGHVDSAEPHPNADRLRVAQVSDGQKTHQVVCGGANCRAGMKVAFAPVGAKILGLAGKTITMEPIKLRGVDSGGMLCAGSELHLEKESDGIMELPDDAPLGENLANYLYDPVLEIGLTPNLGHCTSILGISREVAALLDTHYGIPKMEVKGEKSSSFAKEMRTSIDSKDDCWQYHLRKIEGVKVGPSPKWLQERLEKSGFGCINNVVDAINYTMMEVGQPMHGFDAAKLHNKHLRVARSPNEVSLETLDGIKRKIPANTLLIYDGETPVAVAGLIGGEESAISESTHDVVLEAAQFCPQAVRQSIKKLGVRTDSSFRFEKGIDGEAVTFALDRAVALICEIAGGTPCKETVSATTSRKADEPIELRLEQIERLVGVQLSQNEVMGILERLEFDVKMGKGKTMIVTPPSYRNDVKTEIDVIEEVARIYGFNNIPKHSTRYTSSSVGHCPAYLMDRIVRERLLREGLQEFLTCNLISPHLATIGMGRTLTSENLVKVLHAKSIDQSILRSSFLPGMLASLKHNHNLGTFDVSAFEMGTLHFKDGERFVEKRGAAILLSGERTPYHYEMKPAPVDFFDLKGHVENLLIALGISQVEFKRSSFGTFHPGRQAEVFARDELIGILGEVHPEELAKLDIEPRRRVYFAELDMEKLALLQTQVTRFSSLPQFPSSQRDITLTVSQEMTLEQIHAAIIDAQCTHLRNIELIDIFKDAEKVGQGKQNVTLRFTYRDDNATIETKVVDEEHALITSKLQTLT